MGHKVDGARKRASRGRGAGAAGDVVRDQARRNRSASRSLRRRRAGARGSAVTAPHLAQQMPSQTGVWSGQIMAEFYRRLRQLVACAAFAGVTAFALVPSVDAQWLPFGAAPPGEIVQRLRAEGYVLIHPLERRDTVYLADVASGPAGHERLVIDAWSGEILQRFVVRRGGYAPEGGEFSEPPPLGPPPARAFREGNSRDFREGNYGNGPEGPSGGYEVQPRARAKSRPAAAARKGGEPRQTPPPAQPAEPQNAGTGSPGGAPAAAASSNPPPSAGKPEKKVNDVPVNPLE